MIRIRTFLRSETKNLREANKALTAVGILMIPVFLFALIGLIADPRIITGMPAWLKPAKFAISISVYTFTLAWIFRYLPEWPRLRMLTGWITAVTMVLEMAIIATQASRGTASHFNVGTPLDASLFIIMGIAIVIALGAAIAVAVALFMNKLTDPVMGWAVRMGILIMILGAATGGLMTVPTGAQLAEARAAHPLTISGAHTVGAPDGDHGIPITGWSQEHGDLRVPHFIGLHALQILPLIAWLWNPGRTKAMIAMGCVYALLFFLTLAQALAGWPLLGWGASLSPEQIFSLCNMMAMAGWILLILTPWLRWPSTIVAGRVIPLLLSGVYFILLAAHWGERNGGFGSLAGVASLFANHWLLLAGWIHYLAFDLLIGSWEVRDAGHRKMSRWLLTPCLGLTFMFGPVGLLSYLGARSALVKLRAGA